MRREELPIINRALIRAIIRQYKVVNSKILLYETQLPKATLFTHLKKLIEDGEVSSDNSLYYLTEKAETYREFDMLVLQLHTFLRKFLHHPPA